MKQKKRSIVSENYQFGGYRYDDLKEGASHYLFLGVLFVEQAKGVYFLIDEHARHMNEKTYALYKAEVSPVIVEAMKQKDNSMEVIYDKIMEIRRKYDNEAYYFKERPSVIGIDQSAKREELRKERKALVVITRDYLKDLPKILKEGDVVLVKKQRGILPSKEEVEVYTDRVLLDQSPSCFPDFSKIELDEDVFINAYGEELLTEIKDLSIPAVLETTNDALTSKMMLNRFEERCLSTVYIPPFMNMVEHNEIVSVSTMNYAALAKLEEQCGRAVERASLIELYRMNPDLFVDYYEEGESGAYQLPLPDSLDEFRKEKLNYANERIRELGITLHEYYLDEAMKQCEDFTLFPKDVQKRFLVNEAVISKEITAELLHPNQGESPRHLMKRIGKGPYVLSNFLFFMTERLIMIYNMNRKLRPKECLAPLTFGLDYQYENGTETFPLYRKSGIAMIKDEGIRLTDFTLKAGCLRINEDRFAWDESDVNPSEARDVAVYTPMYSENDQNSSPENWNYVLPVGNDRVNIVIVDRQIQCIRNGDVFLPCVGVVLSLSKERFAKTALSKRNMDDDGYYDIGDLSMELHLENPSSLEDELWEKCIWAYGGAMGLMKNGNADYQTNLLNEGWFRRLSQQTQETPIQKLERHPRTVFASGNGQVYLFVISGRTRLSQGADYHDILKIIRTLEPSVDTIVNADGGGSSAMAAAFDGHLIELNVPCCTTETPTGKIRNINTVFVMHKGERL